MFCHVEWQVKKYDRIYMQAHILLTNQGRNRVVDVCGLVCLTGYAALAWYSRGTTWAPGADLAIGSRTLGRQARGALSPGQALGNRIICALIRLLWGQQVTRP